MSGSTTVAKPAPAERKPVGRAGRNLPAAIVVGASLGALVIITLFTVRALFIAVVCVAIAIGSREIVTALRAARLAVPLVPVVAIGTALPAVAYARGSEGLALGLLLGTLLTIAWRLFSREPRIIYDVAGSVLALVYVGFLAGFAGLMAEPSDGPRRVVAFIATVVCSDVGGYTAGVLSGGRHKMAPSVSPGKSWEGLAGSCVACMVAGALFFTLMFHQPVGEGLLFGLAVVASATLGDLGESMMKRDIGIKDMGNLLPGHGGMLDRLDSLLATAPVAWLLLRALVPVS